MQKLIVMCGIPGSGKTTHVNNKYLKSDYNVHSSDELFIKHGYYKELFSDLHNNILRDLNNGYNCVYDATNISKSKRKYIVKFFKKFAERNIEIICDYFKPNLNESLLRNSIRGNPVPENIIVDMFTNFDYPTYDEGFDIINKLTKEDYNENIH